MIISKTDQLCSIIIINFNGKKWLKDCFDSVYRQTYQNFEIIFIDNASTDDSIDFVRSNYPKVKIIQNNKNIGFGRANNLGVKKAKGEVIFFLNNDTVINKDILQKLIIFKTKNNLDIVGPKILNYEGKNMHLDKKRTIDYTGYLGYGSRTFYIDGCALMINKKDFKNLGGFDEKYFIYSEEIDLCWRAHLYGLKVEVCNTTSIRHYTGATGGSTNFKRRGEYIVTVARRYEVEKNNLRNVLKNYGWINLLWVLPLFVIQSIGESFVYLLTGNQKAWKSIFQAYYWNLINLSDTLKHRKVVQQKRVIGDNEILKMMSFRLNKLRAFISIGVPRFK